MNSTTVFENLVASLDQIVKVYRSLLQVVRKEKEILIAAKLDDLTVNNQAKEEMLISARNLEHQRQKIVAEFLLFEKIDLPKPTLLTIANHLDNERAEKLRSMNTVLDLLTKRVRDINAENEVLVKSALDNITGAMNSIKDMLTENKTYKNKGTVQATPAQSGQLVSKQV